MGVMVAVALSGIIAVAVSNMLTNQAKIIKQLEVRAQRAQLIRHYRDAVNAGLLNTLIGRCGKGNFCGADGSLLIPHTGLYLSDDVYDYGNIDREGKWWKVTAHRAPSSKYAGQPAIELTVAFLNNQHPVVNMALETVTEVILIPSTP